MDKQWAYAWIKAMMDDFVWRFPVYSSVTQECELCPVFIFSSRDSAPTCSGCEELEKLGVKNPVVLHALHDRGDRAGFEKHLEELIASC